MRFQLRTFALLDVISMLLMSMQLWSIVNNFDRILLNSEKLKAILMVPMFVLLLLGTIYLWKKKTAGFVLYYIQFPFRFYLWVFSLGFITLFPELFGRYEDYWLTYLLKVCMVAEVIRLYLTVVIHRKLAVSFA
jgi:hypothetical protein